MSGARWRTQDIPFPLDRTRNPTEHHRTEAAEHTRHAKAHAAAAAKLRADEARLCAAVTQEDRAVCPLARSAWVEAREDGSRWPPRPGVSAGELAALMRCHAAEALSAGLETMAMCPFGVAGARIEVAPDGSVVTATAAAREAAGEIVRRAYALRVGDAS